MGSASPVRIEWLCFPVHRKNNSIGKQVLLERLFLNNAERSPRPLNQIGELVSRLFARGIRVVDCL